MRMAMWEVGRMGRNFPEITRKSLDYLSVQNLSKNLFIVINQFIVLVNVMKLIAISLGELSYYYVCC